MKNFNDEMEAVCHFSTVRQASHPQFADEKPQFRETKGLAQITQQVERQSWPRVPSVLQPHLEADGSVSRALEALAMLCMVLASAASVPTAGPPDPTSNLSQATANPCLVPRA